MKRSFGKLFFIPLILLALAFSALGVTTAHADDANPPPATEEPVPPVVVDESAGDANNVGDTTDETEAVVDEVAESDDSAAVDESAGDADSMVDTTEAVVDEVVESDDSASVDESAGEANSADETTGAESQDCIPQPIDEPTDGEIQPEVSETGIPCAPQESNGENQPDSPETSGSESLASVAEAETLFSGDPMWCPAGVLPGGAGCTASFASFTGPTGLIAALEAGATYAGAGTIYVSWDYSVSEWIHIDYGNIALTDLVFQGGWNFTSNSVVGETTFSKEINFYDWGGYGTPGSLTINDINVNGLAADGLGIYNSDDITTANVILNNVTVANQDGGAFIETTGSVTVNNSEFVDNFGGSLGISSPGGTVTINNSRFDNSNYDGIDIYTDGNVILNNVITNGNSYDGIYITGYDDYYAGSVSVNGGTFTNNGDGTFNSAYGINAYACQLNLDGAAQSFGGNQSGDVFFEQDPACVELNEDKDKKKPQPTTSTSALCAVSELKAGDVRGTLNNLCGINVLMSEILEEDLPAELSDEMTFHLGVKIAAVGFPTGGYIELYFPVPKDVDEENLVVLFWNETEWVETLGGEVVDSFFVIKVSEPGVYVLSSK